MNIEHKDLIVARRGLGPYGEESDSVIGKRLRKELKRLENNVNYESKGGERSGGGSRNGKGSLIMSHGS